jgi:hypothetical protein
MKTAIVALTLLAVSAWAQPTPPPQPGITQLKAYLTLTDAQVQALQTIQSQLRTSTSALRQQIADKQTALSTNLAAGGSSAAALGQLLLDIQALQKQISEAQAAAQPQAVAILTQAQQPLLQALVAAAKLQPEVREAETIGLIAPAPGAGGPAGRGGPQMAPGRGGANGGPMMAPGRGGFPRP